MWINIEKKLLDKNFSNFPKTSDRLINIMDDVMSRDLPILMNNVMPVPVKQENSNPFDVVDWVVSDKDFKVYQNVFNEAGPESGRLPGEKAKNVLLQTGIPKGDLRVIWQFCDTDVQGSLDSEEFALAMWFVAQVKKGSKLPPQPTEKMIPPSKRTKR